MADQTFTLGVSLETKEAQSSLKDLQKELEKTSNSAKGVGKGFGESLGNINDGIKDLTGNLQGLSGQSGVSGVADSVIGLTSNLGLAAGAMVGLGAVAIAAASALVLNSSAMAAAADDAAELADKYGITTTQLAALTLIASENGSTVSGLIGVYDKLSNSLDEVQSGNLKTENAFRRLGLSQSDLAGKSKEEIAGLVIKNYEALGRTIQSTAAVQDILGKSFREQIPSIRAAADEYAEYEKRIQGTVASAALEEAGRRQEEALNGLGLAFKEFRTTVSGVFSDNITDAANWSRDIIKSANQVAVILGAEKVSIGEKLKIELEERKKLGISGLFTGAVGGDADKAIAAAAERILALSNERKAIDAVVQSEDAAVAAETRRLAARSRARIVPLPDKPKPVTEIVKLTDPQKDIQKFRDTMLSSFGDIDKQLTITSLGSDDVAISVTNLAFKLYDAGKGVVSYADALKVAQTQQEKFVKLQEQKINLSIDKTLTNLARETEYLKLGNKEREVRVALDRAAADAGFKSTAAFESARPTAAGEIRSAATARVLTGIDVAGQQQIESLREQSMLLSVVNEKERTRIQTQQDLYKAIDPEGKGENITRAQKAEIDALSSTIEKQKELIEINRKMNESFASVGDAVVKNMLRMSDSSKNLKFELIKLAAVMAMKYFATSGTANTFTNAFLGSIAGTRATGGPVDAGKSYLVGEKGPEIVKFNQPGYVIPNHQITNSSRNSQITIAPSLIIQGSITGQSELDRAFEEFSGQLATQLQSAMVSQAGANGIYRTR